MECHQSKSGNKEELATRGKYLRRVISVYYTCTRTFSCNSNFPYCEDFKKNVASLMLLVRWCSDDTSNWC